jgi:drug/metabolite transporter (DMT)-like permease
MSTSSNMSEKLGLFSLAGAAIVTCQICCEIGKQISNYSIQYYNGGRYPLPQTILVVLLEAMKLLVTVMRSGCQKPSFDSSSLRKSTKFLLPSVIYAVNNNIYLAGLILVPPPIWVILCSFRTVVTASMYKFVLKRDISLLQFTGALIIVASIVVAKLGDILSVDGGNHIPMMAIIFAVVSSFNSVGAAVYTESLFKTSGENFLEQQFWLYLYGMLVAAAVHAVSAADISPVSAFSVLQGVDTRVQGLLVVAILFGSVGGLVVATILKRLDNVVKEYSSATANMFTAILCSLMFPEKFSFTAYIVVAMVLLFTGIFMYERMKTERPTRTESENKEIGEQSAA